MTTKCHCSCVIQLLTARCIQLPSKSNFFSPRTPRRYNIPFAVRHWRASYIYIRLTLLWLLLCSSLWCIGRGFSITFKKNYKNSIPIIWTFVHHLKNNGLALLHYFCGADIIILWCYFIVTLGKPFCPATF